MFSKFLALVYVLQTTIAQIPFNDMNASNCTYTPAYGFCECSPGFHTSSIWSAPPPSNPECKNSQPKTITLLSGILCYPNCSLAANGSEISCNYPSNANVSWIISPPGASSIMLIFTKMDIETGNDLLTVDSCFDVTCKRSSQLLVFSSPNSQKQVLPPALTSDTGVIRVGFTSNGNISWSGWSAYWLSNYSACLPCALGEFKGSSGLGSCLKCLSGTYSSFPAASSCLQCEAGKYSSNLGMSICQNCTPFATSQNGSSYASDCLCRAGYTELNSTFCVPCSPGQFKPSSGSSPCLNCSVG